MFIVIISLLLSTVVHVALANFAKLNVWYAAIAALVVFGLCFVLLTRVVMKKVGALMEEAQRDLQASRVEKAIRLMESGFKYAPWQFGIKSQINSQIGSIYYMRRDFTKAFDYLQKGSIRHWMAMAMLGICYMKRNKTSKMIDTFEKAVAANKKEPMAWNVYGFCLEKVGDRERAVKVMEKGLKRVGGHELLEENLQAMQEGRKMKMQKYGDMWYQFHLEKPGALIKKQTKAMTGRRKTVVRR